MTKDYYSILGLDSKATKDQIKKAYFKLAKQYHPDANVGNSDDKLRDNKFKEITNAYNILSDDKQKFEYDLKRQQYTSQDFRDIFGSSFGNGNAYTKTYHQINLHVNKDIKMDMNSIGRKKIEYSFINYDDNNKKEDASIIIDFFPFDSNGLGYEVRYDIAKNCNVLVGSFQFQGRGHIQNNRVGSLYVNYIIELPSGIKIENGCDVIQEHEISLYDALFGLSGGIVIENIHKKNIKISTKNINNLSSINLTQKYKGLYRNGKFGDYVYRLKIKGVDLSRITDSEELDKLKELILRIG